MNKTHSKIFFENVSKIANSIDLDLINKLALELKSLRKRSGRLFLLGVGGSAANCTHAVNDFRILCNIESYTPVDNVSELTARINDSGWNGSFVSWLKASNCSSKDALFILSVGGGNIKKKVSVNIIEAIKYAKLKKCNIYGIVGKKNSFTEKNSKITIVIPSFNNKLITPMSEAFQAVIWHSLVSNPELQVKKTKW